MTTNDGFHNRVREAVRQTLSYWYTYQVKDYDGYDIDAITHLWGPLYTVSITLRVWHTFRFSALYLDVDNRDEGSHRHPTLFIDAYMLSHLVETPMLNHYQLQDVDETVERILRRHKLID
jgi:glycosidase